MITKHVGDSSTDSNRNPNTVGVGLVKLGFMDLAMDCLDLVVVYFPGRDLPPRGSLLCVVGTIRTS